MAAKPIPDGFPTATPYLIVKGAEQAIAFYKAAFGATETMCLTAGGKVCHAEIRIGSSPIMLADEVPEMGAVSPQTLGGTPVGIMLYVEDVDALTEQAIRVGAKVFRPLQDQFYGDRSATLTDPFGHQWTLATHKIDIPIEELQRQIDAMARKTP
jgi:PhnB protein